ERIGKPGRTIGLIEHERPGRRERESASRSSSGPTAGRNSSVAIREEERQGSVGGPLRREDQPVAGARKVDLIAPVAHGSDRSRARFWKNPANRCSLCRKDLGRAAATFSGRGVIDSVNLKHPVSRGRQKHIGGSEGI